MDFREKSLSRGTAGHRSLGKEDAGDCRPRARAASAAESAGTRPLSRPATSPPGLPRPAPPALHPAELQREVLRDEVVALKEHDDVDLKF